MPRPPRLPARGPTPGRTTSHWDASSRAGVQRPGFLGHVDHINPVRQGRVEPVPHVAHGARFRERKLQVLSLTRGPRRGRASVGDLRVRRESGRVGDGQTRPANSPFNGPRDIPVTGETHPASFSVPDKKTLDDGRRRGLPGRPRRNGTRHLDARPWSGPRLPSDGAPATVSGSSRAPVGPVWISVPMVGHTPQS